MAEDECKRACRACEEILARAACLERWAASRKTRWDRIVPAAFVMLGLVAAYILLGPPDPAWLTVALHYVAMASMAGVVAWYGLALWQEGRGPWCHAWLAVAAAVMLLWAWSLLEEVGALPVRLGTVMSALDGTGLFGAAVIALWVKMVRRERDFAAAAQTFDHLKRVCERMLPGDAAVVTDGLRNAGNDPLPWPWSRRLPALRREAAARVAALAGK